MTSVLDDMISPFAAQQGPIDDDTVRWWVVHTRPRCEKKIHDWLQKQGWSTYLPTRKSLRQYKSKRVRFDVPLFPGYAFGAFAARDKHQIFYTNYAANFLEVLDQPTFLRQLGDIRELLERGADVQRCPYLQKGQRVRITSGRLAGIEGRVRRVAGKTRVVLDVDLLRQSVCVEVESEMLAPCVY